MTANRLSFAVACGLEGALLVVALLVAWLFGMSAPLPVRWSMTDVLIGVLGTLPMFLAFAWMMQASAPAVREVREFLERTIGQIMGNWRLWQLAVVSIVAGISEEALFRGVIQGGLTSVLGEIPAIAIASLLFGLCHPITRVYVAMAAVFGVYLGAQWALTGNLLAPVVTHALYDFGALFYLMRRTRPAGRPGSERDRP
jgi:membrane protease YdiL (CAAX protease family)